ncbi:MAG TPA: hypothetical protein VK575_12310 [Gemmatimonadaceae bacterium]|nr:hypothetical protein [Gemmatimonadaceae bacterium]
MEHVTREEGGTPVIEIDCGRDIGRAVMFVVLAFQRLFECSLFTHCVAYFEGVAIRPAPSLTGVEEI